MSQPTINFYEAAKICGYEGRNRHFSNLLTQEMVEKRIFPCSPPDAPGGFGDQDVHPSNLHYDPVEIGELASRCKQHTPPSETRA